MNRWILFVTCLAMIEGYVLQPCGSTAALAQPTVSSADPAANEHGVVCEFGADGDKPVCQSGHADLVPSPEGWSPIDKAKPPPHYGGDKIAPELLLQGDRDVDVIIGVETSVGLQRLPEEPEQRVVQWNAVAADRAAERRTVVDVVRQLAGVVLEEYTMGNAIVARMPLKAAIEVSDLPRVIHVMPRYVEGEAPDSYGNPDADPLNDVDDGRSRIHSDPFSAYGGSGYVALLDTGVRRTHQLLYESASSPNNRIRLWKDCLCGGDDCEDVGNPQCPYEPGDRAMGTGHGTKTASILSGRNTQLGTRYIGVTSAKIDSWAVYPTIGWPDAAVVIKAVERAVWHGARVIVAELQLDAAFNSAVATAFDNAYDQGVIVVAANGNFGYTEEDCSDWPLGGSVRCPANAHKVLGVGYYNVKDPSEYTCGMDNGDEMRQSLGPTTDGRVKPDLRMPTRSETGCRLSDSCIDLFAHTSGATPYAAGAALLTYNFFNANQMLPSPGKIYAALLAFGHSPELSYFFQYFFGADQVRLGEPTGSTWITGMRYVSNGENEDFMFPVTTGHECDLHAAIWWPETASGNHSDVDLYVFNGSGNEVISSTDDDSIFERGKIDGALTASTSYWRFRMHGANVPSWATVYYFLYYRTNCN